MKKLFLAEAYKYRRTFIIWLHILLPAFMGIAFATYGLLAPTYSWQAVTKAYFEVLGIGFPLIISIICQKSIELDKEAGNFQALLTSKKRLPLYMQKLLFLIALEILAVVIAIVSFSLLYGGLVNHLTFYLVLLFAYLLSTIFLYCLHIDLAFIFGNGLTIIVGIFDSLIAALFLTGLGDFVWKFVPCSWSSRLIGLIMAHLGIIKSVGPVIERELLNWILLLFIMTILIVVASLIWFNHWEGRSGND